MHTIIFFPDPEVAENIGQLTSNNMYNASMAGSLEQLCHHMHREAGYYSMNQLMVLHSSNVTSKNVLECKNMS